MMRLIRQAPICLIAVLAFKSLGQANQTSASPKACSATGDLEIQEFRSDVFDNARKLRVLVPPGYSDQRNLERLYPVLYLNDGQNLFDICTSIFNPMEWRADETVNRLVVEGRVEPLIIVGIDNAGKHERPNEYLPFPDATLRPYMANVHGIDYPRFLTQEVMPFVEKKYRVRKGASNTGLGGSSYGGLITFYVVSHTHNVFGRVLIESPSLEVMDFAVLKEAANNRDWPGRIYFGGGTDEDPPGSRETIPGDISKAVRLLRKNGVSRERIFVNITPGHHNEEAWAARLPAALEFLFPGHP